MTTPLTDGQLLREFAVSRDQHAFRSLVQRHQDMVFSTALRRTGHSDLAADVGQQVFLALATKAARLSTRSSVGGWLYKATLLESARRQRDEFRRTRRERRYAEESLNQNPAPNPMDDPDETRHTRELLPLLDEAMSGLAADDREALVLRFMRGLSLRDTGAALGTTEEAARKRVTRALEKLSRLFRRRGAMASTALLAATVLPQSVNAAPAAFTGAWTGAAAAAPALGPGGALLLKAAALSKPQLAAACALLSALPLSWQAWKISTLKARNHELTSLAASPAAPPASLTAHAAAAPAGFEGPVSSPAEPAAEPSSGKKDRRGKFDRWRELQRTQQRAARLAALHAEIGLADYQLEVIDQATAAADEALRARRDPSDSPLDRARILTDRDQTIAAVLDAAAWEEYQDFCRDEERSRREVLANRLLGDLQTTLHLTEPQKDQLFSLFASEADVSRSQVSQSPVETMDSEQTERMAEILTEDQFRLWRQRTEMWSQYFQSGRKEEP